MRISRFLDTPGPAGVTFAEFAPLFDADELRLDASGLGGTQDTWQRHGRDHRLYRGVRRASASTTTRPTDIATTTT